MGIIDGFGGNGEVALTWQIQPM